MHSVTGRFHEQRASERPENALLPLCYPTPYYRAGRARIERAFRTEIARQINMRRDASAQNRTAKAEFQDRCLKPLGHPSIAVISMPWPMRRREHHGNNLGQGPQRGPKDVLDPMRQAQYFKID